MSSTFFWCRRGKRPDIARPTGTSMCGSKRAYGIYILMDPAVLRDVIDGLVRNGIENTPDGGCVTISLEERGEQVLVHVTDSGVGISEENQQYIFDGLFHTEDTELYASRLPYEFGAGGKGLDLLRMKIYRGALRLFPFDEEHALSPLAGQRGRLPRRHFRLPLLQDVCRLRWIGRHHLHCHLYERPRQGHPPGPAPLILSPFRQLSRRALNHGLLSPIISPSGAQGQAEITR